MIINTGWMLTNSLHSEFFSPCTYSNFISWLIWEKITAVPNILDIISLFSFIGHMWFVYDYGKIKQFTKYLH
jgi:hypothetical protein